VLKQNSSSASLIPTKLPTTKTIKGTCHFLVLELFDLLPLESFMLWKKKKRLSSLLLFTAGEIL